MAIDMFHDNSSLLASPRISFSNDLHDHTGSVPREKCPCRADSSLLDSDYEFDFCINSNYDREISAADELFSNGLIKPGMLQDSVFTSKHISISISKSKYVTSLPPLPVPSTNESSRQKTPKQIISTSFESEKVDQSKSFWKIKRSSSVHCDNNSNKKGSFWLLPGLSRSNSTGLVPNSKQMLKDNQKQNSYKHGKGSMAGNSSCSSSFYYTNPLSQKPQLNKYYGGLYGKGVRISPVLNVPPPYISKGTANFFGLGSFFCSSKDKKNKK